MTRAGKPGAQHSLGRDRKSGGWRALLYVGPRFHVGVPTCRREGVAIARSHERSSSTRVMRSGGSGRNDSALNGVRPPLNAAVEPS